MGLANYDELKAAIARTLRRDDLEADIPDFIILVEGAMNRRLRVRRMLAQTSLTLDGEYVAAPNGFLGVRSFALDGTLPRPLRFMTPEAMDERRGVGGGAPDAFAVVGDTLRLSPTPSGAPGRHSA